MFDELLPFVLGTLLGVLGRRRRGTMPRAMRDGAGALAACLIGGALTVASGELAITPVFLGVDVFLALAGFAAGSAIERRRGAVVATRTGFARGTP